ncbi:MAG: ATP-dependent Clp protease proteolytic subunit [Spirochaetes bacterium]|nr:ATP-dependent Clp protease proteolytic subunit [Spirochaetota bacterium]
MKIINIIGEIGWNVMPRDVRQQLADAGGEDIRVDITSPGGYVYDGLEIIGLLNGYQGRVDTHIVGYAASMGASIFMAGQKRTAESNAVLMIHNPSGIAVGDYRSFDEASKYFDAMASHLAKDYAAKSGKDVKAVRKLMDAESYYWGDEIASEGFAHEVIKTENAGEKNEALALAKMKFIECTAKMKAEEGRKDDMKKAAALLNLPGKQEEQTPAAGVGNNNNRRSAMTPEQLKAEHPDLYNAIMQAGEQKERERVKAHMNWLDADPKRVAEAIAKGEDFTMAHMSEYVKASQSKTDINDRKGDNPPDTKTPETKDEKEAEDKLLADTMKFSKKSGGN